MKVERQLDSVGNNLKVVYLNLNVIDSSIDNNSKNIFRFKYTYLANPKKANDYTIRNAEISIEKVKKDNLIKQSNLMINYGYNEKRLDRFRTVPNYIYDMIDSHLPLKDEDMKLDIDLYEGESLEPVALESCSVYSSNIANNLLNFRLFLHDFIYETKNMNSISIDTVNNSFITVEQETNLLEELKVNKEVETVLDITIPAYEDEVTGKKIPQYRFVFKFNYIQP